MTYSSLSGRRGCRAILTLSPGLTYSHACNPSSVLWREHAASTITAPIINRIKRFGDDELSSPACVPPGAMWVLILSRNVRLPLCFLYVGTCGWAHLSPPPPRSLLSPWTSPRALVHFGSWSSLLTLVTPLHRSRSEWTSSALQSTPLTHGGPVTSWSPWMGNGGVKSLLQVTSLQRRWMVRACLDVWSGKGQWEWAESRGRFGAAGEHRQLSTFCLSWFLSCVSEFL